VLRRQHKASFRAIQDLTKDKHLFHYLHLYFSWILKAGAHRVTEKVLEGPPREELLTDYEAQQTDEAVLAVNTDNKSESTAADEKKGWSPVFTTLRQMLQVLGFAKFHLLAFNVVQGNQLIVRGQPEGLVLSIFETLKILIPSRCFKCVPYSDVYKESWTCNFLGLKTDTEIPTHILESHLYTLMDIKEQFNSSEQTSNNPFKHYSFEIRGKELVHGPQILKKIEEALLNKHFSDSVLDQYLCALKEEWME
ncbi:folliculin-like, partial [Paramuricea clavata]